MQQNYDEPAADVLSLCDDEQYFQHVVCEEHELIAMDMMLCNVLAPVED